MKRQNEAPSARASACASTRRCSRRSKAGIVRAASRLGVDLEMKKPSGLEKEGTWNEGTSGKKVFARGGS